MQAGPCSDRTTWARGVRRWCRVQHGTARYRQNCDHRWVADALGDDQGGSTLDPQDVGLAISAGQSGCTRRAGTWSMCGLFTSVQDVWSPDGPQQEAPPHPPRLDHWLVAVLDQQRPLTATSCAALSRCRWNEASCMHRAKRRG